MSVAIALVGAITMVLLVLFMLRNGQLREKYTILWLAIGILMIILGCFPPLLHWLAKELHVVVPANLLFTLAIGLLAGVGLHVSRELTILEDESRTLAEEVAILRTELNVLATKQARGSAPRLADEDSPAAGVGERHPQG